MFDMYPLLLGITISFPAIFLMVFILRSPKAFILLFIATSPIINMLWQVQLFGFTLVEIYSGILPLFFFLILLKLAKNAKWNWGKQNSLFLIVLLSHLFPIFVLLSHGQPSMNPIETFIKVLCGYASYQLSLNLFTEGDLYKLIKAILLAVFITVGMVTFQLITGIGTGIAEDRYIQGIYHDPGQYTRVAMIGLLVILPLLSFHATKRQVVFRFALLVMCIVTLAVSISRNVVLTAAVCILVYSISSRKFKISVVVILIGTGLYIWSPAVSDTYNRKFATEIAFLSGQNINPLALGSGRIGIWTRTIDDFTQADLIEKLFGTGHGIGPHGQVFDLLRSVGLFGLFTVASFYLRLLLTSLILIVKEPHDLISVYFFMFSVAILVMSIASTPLSNFFLQIIFFAIVAINEKKNPPDLSPLPITNTKLNGSRRTI